MPAPPPIIRCRFKFISSFKWEHRKGWDLLLRAYFNEFTSEAARPSPLPTYLPLTRCCTGERGA